MTKVVDGVCVGIEEAPQTLTGVPLNLDQIPHAELPHATRAVSVERPHGGDTTVNNRTVLQQHVDFFDQNKDGRIFPRDTYLGFRRMGFNIFISAYAVFVIHGTLAYPTHESWIPDPRLPIITRNIHRCHHGSDSMIYDKEGRFMPEKFEEPFAKYDKENKGGLSLRDILQLWNHNRDAYDIFGWSANFLEWMALYLAAVDEKAVSALPLIPDHAQSSKASERLRSAQGTVSKESIRGQYDGTLFYQLARKQEAKKAAGKRDIKDKRT
ncbi:Peroxygenase 1 [Coccomyxa sp. Obi]|nr:Peroxygenase 1 [Coccomyxa sp. Obi]